MDIIIGNVGAIVISIFSLLFIWGSAFFSFWLIHYIDDRSKKKINRTALVKRVSTALVKYVISSKNS